MIDETLTQFLTFTLGNEAIVANPEFARKEALTAIYEIGLECIGADEKPSWDITPESAYKISTKDDELWSQKLKPKKTIVHSESEKARNDLRAAQRKAWAKACGVDNG